MKNIYWKLQSINQTEDLTFEDEEYKIYREHYKKDYSTRELMSESETLEHYRKNAYKNPLFSKIFSLTLAFVENEEIRIIYYTGTEKDLIQTFLNTLKNEYFAEHTITHFDAEYVLPYLGTRIEKNRIRTTLPNGLQFMGLKPWNLTGFCLRSYHSGAGAYKNTLKEIAWNQGLDYSFIDFADEFTEYESGNLEGLKISAKNEIKTLVNVHRNMMGENPIEFVNFEEEFVESVEEIKPTDWLKELYAANQFTNEIREGLKKQIFGKKKPTKKELEQLFTIIRGVYVRTNFEIKDQDSKTTIQKKEKEIKTLLGI